MIRKNPSGDLPVIAESAYVDRTAIICGKVVIGENVFVGPYAVSVPMKSTRTAACNRSASAPIQIFRTA